MRNELRRNAIAFAPLVLIGVLAAATGGAGLSDGERSGLSLALEIGHSRKAGTNVRISAGVAFPTIGGWWGE